MTDNYVIMFGTEPRHASTPMVPGDSPELDTTPELDEDGIRQYQSIVGALQWCITLGRFDVACAVMSLSRFRACPRKGHLERAKRVCGYLKKMSDGAIRFRIGIPHNEGVYKPFVGDWTHSVYGNSPEESDPGDPKPLGKAVRITTFVDANLCHCKVTGKSATGILHVLNQTPIDWYSKKQNTVETATYGSEFMAARIATEQIMDLRMTMRAMGVPLEGAAWMLGDNQSVVTSSTVPHSTLNKRHNALAFHRVRAAIASGMIHFCHIGSKDNPADIMTKFLPFPAIWAHIRPLLFCRGDTSPPT